MSVFYIFSVFEDDGKYSNRPPEKMECNKIQLEQIKLHDERVPAVIASVLFVTGAGLFLMRQPKPYVCLFMLIEMPPNMVFHVRRRQRSQ